MSIRAAAVFCCGAQTRTRTLRVAAGWYVGEGWVVTRRRRVVRRGHRGHRRVPGGGQSESLRARQREVVTGVGGIVHDHIITPHGDTVHRPPAECSRYQGRVLTPFVPEWRDS